MSTAFDNYQTRKQSEEEVPIPKEEEKIVQE